ncbi:MAG: RluA family pseudouridine synthase [Verrucomicrobia bacterium]|nr:RluA family pseudouridine synthase [Verrucomicrobiota bacterium]
MLAAMFTVSDNERGQRLDRFLQTQMPERSRAFLQKLIEEGQATVNGQPSKASYKVRAGDVVSVEVPPPRPLDNQPEAIPLNVLYEDEDLIVVNKAAGMVVHPAAGNYEHTLVNALLHHCRGGLSGIGGVERPGIVHRLDKGTSGCIVVAKNDTAHCSLVEQFKARKIHKVYRALCWGTFVRPIGRIETDIGRSARDRQKMSARVARGRAALSEYRVLKQLTAFALVEVTPHTGRTHQIRVHMAHIGHPLVGDAVYGRARAAEIAVDRPMLHAYKLGFTHPRTGDWLEFEAPVPEDMANLCKS